MNLDNVPDLRALQVIVAIADTGSFGAAARELGLTQQAISERVRVAEGLCGLTLFTRTRRGAVPTLAGVDLTRQARVVLLEAERWKRIAASLRDPAHTLLDFAASQTILDYYAAGWIARLRAENPGMRFRVQGGNSVAISHGVAQGTIALGFIESLYLPEALSLNSAIVGKDEIVLAVLPEHPWAARGAISAEEVRTTPLILREPGSGTREVVERQLGGLAPAVAELGEQVAVAAAIRELRAPGVLPAVALGDLVAVRIIGVDLTRPLRAVWREGTRPRGAERMLIDVAGYNHRP